MRRVLIAIILLISTTDIKSQLNIAGSYKSYPENNGVSSLVLNCNKSFRLEDRISTTQDSIISSSILGTWKIKKDSMLYLYVDAIISDLQPFGNLKVLKYHIRHKRLYLKVQTPREYRRQNKRFDKKYNNGSPGSRDDYETYKIKQLNTYFLLTNNFECE